MIQWVLAIWSQVPLPFLNPTWTSGSLWITSRDIWSNRQIRKRKIYPSPSCYCKWQNVLFYDWIVFHSHRIYDNIYMSNIYITYMIYIYISHLLYPVIFDGHSDCFHILAIVNNAALNTGVHIFFWISVWYIPSVGIAGSYGSSIFSFLSTYGLMGSFLTQII